MDLPKYLEEELEEDLSEKEEFQIKLAIINSLEDSIKLSKNDKEILEMTEKVKQLKEEIDIGKK